MDDLKTTLMKRDGITEKEAQGIIDDAKADLMERIDAGEFVDDVEFMMEHFSLEPDYLMELLD